MNAVVVPKFPRWILVTLCIVAFGFLVFELRGVLTPIFFSFLIAYLLNPVVNRLERWRVPRSLAIAVILTVALGALTLFLLLIVPGIVNDLAKFVEEVPILVKRVLDRAAPTLTAYGLPVPHSMGEAVTHYQVDAQGIAARAATPVATALGWLVGSAASLIGGFLGLIVIPMLAAYLLYDFGRMRIAALSLTPPRWRPFLTDIGREIDATLSQFVRGQLIVMASLATMYAVSFSLLGVRLGMTIGLVAGLLSFIPYVGGITAISLATLMCVVDWGGWGKLGGVLIAYGLIQLVESFVLAPRVLGGRVGLPAVWVMLALMIGGELFGFLGVLLAVPAAAIAKIFVIRLVEWYRKSAVFVGDDAVAPPSGADALSGVVRSEGLPDDPATRAEKHEAEETGTTIDTTIEAVPLETTDVDIDAKTGQTGGGA